MKSNTKIQKLPPFENVRKTWKYTSHLKPYVLLNFQSKYLIFGNTNYVNFTFKSKSEIYFIYLSLVIFIVLPAKQKRDVCIAFPAVPAGAA